MRNFKGISRMDGPKLFLFGYTLMQPHSYILLHLPFIRLKKMDAQ